MASPVARVEDIVTGICDGPGHAKGREFYGTFMSGSNRVSADGRPVVCVGDLGETDCGHSFIALTGSDVWSIDGAPVHRQGDLVEVIEGGSGVTITGSEVVSSD